MPMSDCNISDLTGVLLGDGVVGK